MPYKTLLLGKTHGGPESSVVHNFFWRKYSAINTVYIQAYNDCVCRFAYHRKMDQKA